LTVTVSPSFAVVPVPVTKSLVTSFVGAAVFGTVMVGFLESGPLLGVVTVGVVEVEVVVEVAVAE
jgi:hypothetical protein